MADSKQCPPKITSGEVKGKGVQYRKANTNRNQKAESMRTKSGPQGH